MSTLSVRRPLALLAVLGMVATLLFAVVGTASAATVTPDNEALFSACPVNASIPDAGFVDVPAASNSFDAINCLAYYAVTAGTTPDTYGPSETVSRTQMAVFLARMAENAGVDLDSSPPAAGFTDIGGLSAEAQDAINALAATTPPIVSGTSATTFNPTGTVSRTQMALFLTRFSNAADMPVHGPGGQRADDVASTATTNFADISSVVAASQTAITQVFHLGVASGTTATTYDPTGTVSRAQMAMFMTRLMGHMNTRPAGVNIQANPMSVEGDIVPAVADPLLVKYSVTTRNADFSPDNDTRVDAFKFYADKATDTPFKTDGTCDTAKTEGIPPYGGVECMLTTADGLPSPNVYGNFGADWTNFVVANTAFTTLYAWTGPLDTVFHSGTTYSSVQITGEKPLLDYAVLSVNVDPDLVVRFGTEVTWTVQLMGTDDKPFAKAGVDVEFSDFWEDYEEADVGDIVKTVATDASGMATYSVTEELFDKAHEAWHEVSATIPGPPVVPVESEYGPDPSIKIWWSAVDPYAASVWLSTPTDYKVISETGTTPNTVTATVRDQYGDLYTDPGQVKFWSEQSEGLGEPSVTRSLVGGYASVDYVWDAGSTSAMEQLFAEVVSGSHDTGGSMDFFWVDEGVAGDVYEGPAPAGDVDVNEMIVASGGIDFGPFDVVSEYGIFLLTWKADDRYLVEGVPSTMAEFETFADEALLPLVTVNKYLDPADDGKTSWNVQNVGGP